MAGLSNALVAYQGTALVASEGTADKVVNGYAAQAMNYLGSFGSYVTTKGSDAYSAVSTQAGKCANGTVELAKSGLALGQSGVDSSVKFVQENPKTVGVAAVVATVAAAVAAYRKLTLGYVFYAAKTDKN